MKESGYQKKISDQLEREGYYVLKLMKTNRNGIADLLALKKDEVYFIECKKPGQEAKPLQDYRLKELKKRGFRVAVSYGENIEEIKSLDYFKKDELF